MHENEFLRLLIENVLNNEVAITYERIKILTEFSLFYVYINSYFFKYNI